MTLLFMVCCKLFVSFEKWMSSRTYIYLTGFVKKTGIQNYKLKPKRISNLIEMFFQSKIVSLQTRLIWVSWSIYFIMERILVF